MEPARPGRTRSNGQRWADACIGALFVGCAVAKIPLGQALRTIWPFYAASIAVLMLVTNPMRSLLPAIFLRGVKDEKEQEDAAA